MPRYFIIYKPFQVLSQFSASEGKLTLKDFFKVPPDVYPVGRLDYDSEGLLLLTNDTQLNQRLLHPQYRHEREYWVQVDGNIDMAAIHQLQSGLTIHIDGKPFRTAPCKAGIFNEAPSLPERNPPIRFRKHIPAPWIWMVLTEGKNRQVRKMTAAAGFPTLRLVRYRIGRITIDTLLPGQQQELSSDTIYPLLFE
jgi:23S rRNA pseudouridine2457 synthase